MHKISTTSDSLEQKLPVLCQFINHILRSIKVHMLPSRSAKLTHDIRSIAAISPLACKELAVAVWEAPLLQNLTKNGVISDSSPVNHYFQELLSNGSCDTHNCHSRSVLSLLRANSQSTSPRCTSSNAFADCDLRRRPKRHRLHDAEQ